MALGQRLDTRGEPLKLFPARDGYPAGEVRRLHRGGLLGDLLDRTDRAADGEGQDRDRPEESDQDESHQGPIEPREVAPGRTDPCEADEVAATPTPLHT